MRFFEKTKDFPLLLPWEGGHVYKTPRVALVNEWGQWMFWRSVYFTDDLMRPQSNSFFHCIKPMLASCKCKTK